MNYGRFFRLNQSLSKVVDGVAIYDYVELPAYFGLSEENLMSPQYPVSVTITSNSVQFRLHYSVYKVEKENTVYGYSVEEIRAKNDGSTDGMKMAHMEEVIFELPYKNDATDRLAEIIKELYYSKFPQRIANNKDNQRNSSGGRFLEQLIRSRFPSGDERKKDKSVNQLKKELYESLQKAVDTLPSYSTLWLMDLMSERNGGEESIDLYEKSEKKDIVGFLRKLLLDFLFDIKHSDVFQNSRYYDQMYSGLMSDFYFAALMHKCEYYYYRRLINDKINDKDHPYDSKSIFVLYAEELSRAEDLWVKDIMSPLAEENFDYFKSKEKKERYSKKGNSDRTIWPSWFADPEEEMRRVCFTLKREVNGEVKRHICNVDILIELLDIDTFQKDENADPLLISSISRQCHNNKKLISQWFLKRYDFKDVFHFHLFKYASQFIFVLLGLTLLVFLGDSLFYFPSLRNVVSSIDAYLNGVLCVVAFVNLCYWFFLCYTNKISRNTSDLIEQRKKTIRRRVIGVAIVFVVLSLLLVLLRETEGFGIGLIIVIVGFLFYYLRKVRNWSEVKYQTEEGLQHIMSNLHLLLPRLVASITAAWLTMTMGFDLFVAFFDDTPHTFLILFLVTILLFFVMYEVNKSAPYSNAWGKVWRSLELILISYTISLLIGFVVIDFLGLKYLERGGFVGEGKFVEQYVKAGGYNGLRYKDAYKNNDSDAGKQGAMDRRQKDSKNEGDSHAGDSLKTANDSIRQLMANVDSLLRMVIRMDTVEKDTEIYYRKQVAQLDSVYHTTDSGKVYKNYALMEKKKFKGGLEIFILRDFLIMFSFIAMFMGIFIQLIIFGDNKQMTEL